jgi:hypothetical protein
MRVFAPLLVLLLATACGREPETRKTSEDLRTFDVSEAPPPRGVAAPPPPHASAEFSSAPPPPPSIGPSAAPGVAFNYRYAFRLPGERVAAVQEQHAQACEKLGLERCRITGMRYRLHGENEVEAMLALKLDPSIARAFGKAGIEAVARAEGMLVDSEISGHDAGADIQASRRSEGQLAEDLARIERQLARSGLGASERAELQAQAERLRESIRANRMNREESQESLAKTPIVFSYGSGDLIPGFDTRSTLSQALDEAAENFTRGLGSMIVLLMTILPWLLLLLLVVWLIRRFGGPFFSFFSTKEREMPPADPGA